MFWRLLQLVLEAQYPRFSANVEQLRSVLAQLKATTTKTPKKVYCSGLVIEQTVSSYIYGYSKKFSMNQNMFRLFKDIRDERENESKSSKDPNQG